MTAFGSEPQALADLGWRGWRRVVFRTARTMVNMETSLRCAGVAFFGLLSIFPSIAIVVLLVGLLGSRPFLVEQMARLSMFMPEIAFTVIMGQLDKLLSQPPRGLGIGLAISVIIALWSGSRGVHALIYAASAAYYESVQRNFIIASLLSLLVTVLSAVFLIVVMAVIAAIPIAISYFPVPEGVERILIGLRWPLLTGLAITAFSLLYRFAIPRPPGCRRQVLPGAILASLLWLTVCMAFSLYVESFGQFEASFGSLAAAVVLLFWLYISAQVFVLGAAFNAEIELRLSHD
ncbi:MAG TPA: YihY/virulence factor BrkB family protein [Pelagibacterium sp.]|uniref:YihY/virulence factor BrkB family protein n=1 Tax=Pelagibacterium sp. TaxID=1967288 RepID=UPI002C9312CF|nr:YihY/virulence factor BrkB family protein [Pelagibacterium sp.]HWJ86760.1 YihY/virulence factor BrkB family protein [Pelagibacterium sp.]